MDFASLSLIIAGLAFVVTIFNSFIELKSIKITQRIQDWLGHESEVAAMEREKQPSIAEEISKGLSTARENQPSIIDEFDSYLNEADEESGTTRLQAMGMVLASGIRKGLQFSGMQEKSVNARTVNKYTQDIHEAVKGQAPPMYKILFKVAEKLGFDLDEIIAREELPQFLEGLNNNGIGLGNIPSSSGKANWKLR